MADHLEPLTIYPRRLRLASVVLLYMVLSAFAAPLLFEVAAIAQRETEPLGSRVAAGVVALFLGAVQLTLLVLLLLVVYRIVVRKPSICVNDEGIVDGCSLIAGGTGLVRWEEMYSLRPLKETARQSYSNLAIYPRYPNALLVRGGPVARLCLRLTMLDHPQWLGLPDWLCSMPADEICQRIENIYGATLDAHHVYVARASRASRRARLE